MSNYEATRVMGGPGATVAMPAAGDPMRTQMGGVVACPVCQSSTPTLETYCGECGFLLASALPGEVEAPSEERPAAELVEEGTGRRIALRIGANSVGRQGADVLLNEGTVSRLHARITVEAARVLVEDRGSSNGSRVGDLRLSPNVAAEAQPGTVLRFGNWKAVIERASVADERTIVVAEPTMVSELLSAATADDQPAEPIDAPSTASGDARLECQDGPGPNIVIPEGETTLGRRPENGVVLTGDPFISGRHACVLRSGQTVTLTDVGSSNGTIVNGVRLEPNAAVTLADGDTVKIGQATYQYFAPAPTLEDPAELAPETDENPEPAEGQLQ